MKIYTKTGDAGSTSLFGGDRVPKDYDLIEAYGTVDELNAFIGLTRAQLGPADGIDAIDDVLARIQDELFIVGADLATPVHAKPSVPRVTSAMTTTAEHDIDRFSKELPELTSFILPGGSTAASNLHLARTVCRRAERKVVAASTNHDVNMETVRYLNRLSDFFFVAARYANQLEDTASPEWHPPSS
jgi:cob(I)alamin adenosyltransferase